MSLKSLKGTRISLKGRMTGLVNYLPSITAHTKVEDLKVRLTSAENFLREFVNTENLIFDKDENEPSEIMEFEEKYYSVVSTLSQWINKHSESTNFSFSMNSSMSTSRSEVKLPKIQIPTFSGDFTEWQSFYDLYNATVHSNVNLKPVEKFQYLKTFLRGDALALLTHLPISDAGYLEAFKKLCQRYDHKKHIVGSFIKTFTGQPSIKTADAHNIRKLLDISDEVIRGLRALGAQAESRDPWLIFMLLNKLDSESQMLWSQFSINKDFPTLKDFFKFLDERADSLQSLHSCVRHATSVKGQSVKGLVATSNEKCPVCNIEHSLFNCDKFNSMSLDHRRKYIRENNRCFNCLSDTHGVFRCMSRKRCQICKKKHNTILHLETTETKKQPSNVRAHCSTNMQSENNITNLDPVTTQDNINNTEAYQISSDFQKTILPTANIMIKNKFGSFEKCCALLDSGSQASFATETLIQRLQLPRENARVNITGMGHAKAGCSRGMATLHVKSIINPNLNFNMQALIVTKLTSIIPGAQLSMKNWEHIKHLKLADPEFTTPKNIDLIIGADHFFNLLCSGKIVGPENQPIAQNTKLGWIVAGPIDPGTESQIISLFTECDVDKTLRRFWEIEELPTITKRSHEEQRCEDHFIKNTTRLENGRFCVRLPFKNSDPQIASSHAIAIQRQRAMERKFVNNRVFADSYKSFKKEYEELGHMIKIPTSSKNDGYFLPHHGVLKESSSTTKLRVVFDASAHAANTASLNEELMVGPVVQDTLYNILLRFRKYKFVLCGDIEKMYRQIVLNPTDTEYQKIVWRTDVSKPMYYYKLLTVTYGTSCAPFLATRSLFQLSLDCKESNPNLSTIISEDMYVDDLMTGANNIKDLLNIKFELHDVLSKAGFNMRKFSSNSILLADENAKLDPKQIEEGTTDLKILGLQWNPQEDNFKFQVNLNPEATTTKRKILSEASRIFDPLGWLAPSIVKVKMFFQGLWLIKLDWDEELPSEFLKRWLQIRSELGGLQLIDIPRWLNTFDNSVELHGFCDASKLAYAAAVYCRVKTNLSSYKILLLTAKTKVAPIKQLSIPRLELCGALLLSRLLNQVKSALHMDIISITAWTDSTIVLDWLSDRPNRWKTFVGNRTSEILDSFNRDSWRHIKSSDNPADCASRGISPTHLLNSHIWWNGPTWLSSDESNWPQDIPTPTNTIIEERSNATCLSTKIVSNSTLEKLIEKMSSFHKLLRVLAYVQRFIKLSRKIKEFPVSGELQPVEIIEAEKLVIRHQQQKHFNTEISCLISNQPVDTHSALKKMKPFLDSFGIIRMGGRIEESQANYEVKHPMIMPGKCHLSLILMRDIHRSHKHAGITLMVNSSRQRYWILRSQDVARRVVNSCIQCCRHRGKIEEQIMADLPKSRVEYSRPFLKVGVDYAGPPSVLLTRRRGQHPQKAYICIFVCMSTKAVHIELSYDLTTESFLAALRRFVARRGICSDIYSDNGTNFVGANNNLRELYNNLNKNFNVISNSLLANRITWHFNPPNAPTFGGLWEAAVKSTKFHLFRVIGQQILTVDEMRTLLTEIEAILNSRPLCSISNEDVDVLTPGHFLIGCPLTAIPEPSYVDVKLSYNERWKLVQQFVQHFWKRWQNEYLTSLQLRNKWLGIKRNIQQEDIVLIKDDNLPPGKWSIGRVMELSPGKDGLVRVVIIKTANGLLRRPINKLILLPVESADSRPAECSST